MRRIVERWPGARVDPLAAKPCVYLDYNHPESGSFRAGQTHILIQALAHRWTKATFGGKAGQSCTMCGQRER